MASSRDYLPINNYSGLGAIGISRRAISSVADIAIREISGVQLARKRRKKTPKIPADTAVGTLFALPSPVKTVFTKEGKISIRLDVILSKGALAAEVCEKIQESIATSMMLLCDTVPFEIRVKVVRYA